MKREDIEIMAPVGSYESLYAAINAGANSVYFGVEGLNMRSKSSANFTLDDLAEIVRVTKENDLKSYLTVNTVLYDQDIEYMHKIIDRAAQESVTAIIAADQAAILYAREKGVEVHLSTQLNISNTESVKFYSKWADVVVLARELSLEQVKTIHQNIETQNITGASGEKIKIEMFAHGALCMAISGKCYLSLHETGCSANRGACRQICRRNYIITDTDTGEQLSLEGNYLLSPKDLCTITFLDKFIDAGVRVLKIEGRARSGEYVKRVCECYNQAIEAIIEGTFSLEKAQEWQEILETVFNRGFWGGYYLGKPVAEITQNYGSSAKRKKVYVGKVTNFFSKLSVAEVLVEASELNSGDDLLFLGQSTGVVEMKTEEIFVDLKPTLRADKGVYCSIKTPLLVRRGDKLYKEVEA
ncbi:MAG: peptidase U32 family protein [Rikenellaceae bacterium]